MQRRTLESNERHPAHARSGIDLFDQSLHARLTSSDLHALVGEKRSPALRSQPACADRHEPRDAMDRDRRTRDAPFKLGPLGGNGVRLRQVMCQEFCRPVQCKLHRGQRQVRRGC